MVEPQKYLSAFVSAGADTCTIHVEAVSNPRHVLEQIRALDIVAGLALNPQTPLTAVEGCLDLCDLVLVMSVNAGFGGQKFNTVALEKLQTLRAKLPAETLLEVDGGINSATIGLARQAGADLFVVGSALFGQSDYTAAVGGLSSLAGH